MSEPFNESTTTRFGHMLVNRNDVYIGKSLIVYGEYSWGEVEQFRQLVVAGNVVLEAGANIGAHTVPLAQMVGPAGAVFAFEPVRLTIQLLNANITLNSLANVHTFRAILGDQPGTALAPICDPRTPNNFGGLTMLDLENGEAVPVRTIDELKLARCDLIKEDVEDMELHVLRGATETIDAHRPALYVENHDRENSPRLITYIEELGYRMWWHTPPLFNPDNYRRVGHDIFGNIISVNMICIPREREITVTRMRPVHDANDWIMDSPVNVGEST